MQKPDKCPKCGSTNIVKFGKVFRAGGKVQRWGCNDCCYSFVGDSKLGGDARTPQH